MTIGVAASLALPGMLTIFGEIRWALLDEGASAFFRLFRGIKERRGAMGDGLQAVDIIGVCIEGILEKP
jgi:hypothetical protein